MALNKIHAFFEEHVVEDHYLPEFLPVYLMALVVPVAGFAVAMHSPLVFGESAHGGHFLKELGGTAIGGVVLYYWGRGMCMTAGALVDREVTELRGSPAARRGAWLATMLGLGEIGGWLWWSAHLLRTDQALWCLALLGLPALAPVVAALGVKLAMRALVRAKAQHEQRTADERRMELAAMAGWPVDRLEQTVTAEGDPEKQKRAISLLSDVAALKRLATHESLASALRVQAVGRLGGTADLREVFLACKDAMDVRKRCIEKLDDPAVLVELLRQEKRVNALGWFKDKAVDEPTRLALIERGLELAGDRAERKTMALLDGWLAGLTEKASLLGLVTRGGAESWPALRKRVEAELAPAELQGVSNGAVITELVVEAEGVAFARALVEHPALGVAELKQIAREAAAEAVARAALARLDEDSRLAVAKETWSGNLRGWALDGVQDQGKLKALFADPEGRHPEVLARIEDQAFLIEQSRTLPRVPALHAVLAEAIQEPGAKAAAALNAAIAAAVSSHAEVLAKEEKAVARGGLLGRVNGTCGACKERVDPSLDQCPHCMAVFGNVEPCYVPTPNLFPKLTGSLRQLVVCGPREPTDDPKSPGAGLGRRALLEVLTGHYKIKDDSLTFPNAYERPRSGKLLLSTRSSWEPDGAYLHSRWLEFTRVSFARFTVRYYETSRLD